MILLIVRTFFVQKPADALLECFGNFTLIICPFQAGSIIRIRKKSALHYHYGSRYISEKKYVILAELSPLLLSVDVFVKELLYRFRRLGALSDKFIAALGRIENLRSYDRAVLRKAVQVYAHSQVCIRFIDYPPAFIHILSFQSPHRAVLRPVIQSVV